MTAPGVIVTGMHRSGTSATTRVLSLLGLHLCRADDLVPASPANPDGHWESATLVRLNDALLHAAGAAWWVPPRPGVAWIEDAAIRARLPRAAAAFAAVHPEAPWVWKDPRTSLTLPFWLEALDARPVVVMCLRDPVAVARSLVARNSVSTAMALALWERYTHTLLRAVDGLPVLLAPYEVLTAKPVAFARGAGRFLAAHGVNGDGRADEEAIRTFVAPARVPFDGDAVLSREQRRLRTALRELPLQSDAFRGPADLEETPGTDALIADARRRAGLSRRPGGAPRRRGAPEVSVVMITRNEGDWLRQSVAAVTATLPRGAEVVVVDDGSTDGSAEPLADWSPAVRVLRAPRRLGVAAARNLGARASRADLLVFSDADVIPEDGWLDSLRDAAARPGAGAVGPAVATIAGDGGVGHGMTFTDAALNLRWLWSSDPEPHPVPLLCGCFMAVPRGVFERVGGFDEGFGLYGFEDVELCVRLWRLGYECLVTGRARIGHRFRARPFDDAARRECVHQLLRFGAVHLGEADLAALARTLHPLDGYREGVSRVLCGDAGERRRRLDAEAPVGHRWFFERFGLRLFEPEANALEAAA